MKISKSLYKHHRFPPEIIQHAVWLYYRFKSTRQVQRFLSTHAAVHNLFNLGRHLVSANHYRLFRQRAFASWDYATAP